MNYAIFGNGTLGRWTKKAIEKNAPDYTLVCMADNNAELQGIEPDGTKVVSAAELADLYKSNLIDTIIVAAQVNWLHLNPLIQQLNNLGIDEIAIIPQYFYDYVGDCFDIDSNLIKLPTDKPCINGNLNIVTNRHCNLKCKGCAMMSNLYDEPCYSDFAQCKKDMLRFKELFSAARYVGIFGGEPLLNKQLPDYIRLARQTFPTASIYIESNGICMLDCEDLLLDTIKECNACILITPYIISEVNEVLIKERCQNAGISYLYRNDNLDSEGFRSSFFKPLDSRGLHTDLEKAYSNCISRGSRYNWHFHNGYMSSCLYPLYIDKYNETFGNTFNVEENDTINIHNPELDGYTLLEYLHSPKPFCRYCAYKDERVFYEWARSKEPKPSDWLCNEVNQ